MPRKIVRVAVAILIALLYFWFLRLTGSPYSFTHNLDDSYTLLGRAFAQGQLHLPIQPAPELLALPNPWDPERNGPYARHDLVFYHGHYYLYHGAAPAVMLFTPWRLIVGHDLPEIFAVYLFCFLGYLFSCALLTRILEMLEIRPPLPLYALLLVALGLCQLAPFILARVLMYEVAIAGGYFCLSAGFYFYARALAGARRPLVWMALAGLMLGLAVGCRPHLAAGAVFAAVPLVFGGRPRRALAVAFILPVAACALAIAAYNYARFGDPLEFGLAYQLRSGFALDIGLSLRKIAPGLYYFLLSPIDLARVFPFARLVARMPFNTYRFSLPPGYFLEPTAGAIFLWPMVLAALAMPRWLRLLPAQKAPRTVLRTVYLSAIATLLLLAATGLSTQRYTMDFLPGLILISCVAMARLNRPIITALAAVLILYSVAVNLGLGVQGPFDDFLNSRPEAYARLARRFSPLPYFRPLLNPAMSVEASFEFSDPEPREQPLVAAGHFGSRYLLSAQSLGGGRWHLVSETSRAYGSRVTAEVILKPRESNRVSLEFTPQNRTMTVRLNGEEVLRHRLEYLITAPAQVMVGIDRTEMGMDEPGFSGKIAGQRLKITAR